MLVTIEQIDRVMEATGADYEQVKAALLKTEGDTEAAIREILGSSDGGDQAYDAYASPKAKFDGGDVAQKVMNVIREVWAKGEASFLVVEKDGRKILNLPLNVSALGLVLAPMASLFVLGAAFLTDYRIYIVLKNGNTYDVGQEALARIDGFHHKP